MAKLTEQDFYFGVGLAALFKYNPYIMPSLIENVTDTKLKGKKIKITKGVFYKLHTLQNGEAIIYIKYTDRKITDKENIGLWKFSLSDIEKNKIDVQRKNVIPFYIVLICVDTNDISNSEVAVLTETEYLEINDRSSIEISLKKNLRGNISRPKVFYVRKFRNDYFTIDRKSIKIGFDELLSKHKKERTTSLHMNKCVNTDAKQLPLDIQSENKTKIKSKNGLQRNKPVIYICNKLKICPRCHKPMEGELYSVNIMSKGVILRKKLTTLKCSSCRKYFLDESVFKSFTQNKKLQDINVKFCRWNPKNMVLSDQNGLNTEKVVKQIYLTNCLGCKKCDSELVIKGCKIALYKNLSVDNQIEKLVNDELFYCKKCDIYYATNMLHGKLLQKYGKNKLNFQNI